MSDYVSEGSTGTWPFEPDIKAKIQLYRDAMEKLLEDEHIHPWKQELHIVQSRIQILDLNEENPDCRATEPDNPQTTWIQLENTIKKARLTKDCRYLILLEGLNPNTVEVLGVQLEIPPEFWFAHFEVETQMRVFNSLMTRQESSVYWKIALPQRFWLGDDHFPSGSYNIYFGNYYRNWEWFGGEDATDKTYAIASFWGKRILNGSSISLVVVDAPHGCLIPQFHVPTGFNNPTFKPVSPQQVMEKEIINLTLESSGFRAKRLYPLITPIWDLLVQAHTGDTAQHSRDPFSSISITRNVICSIWEVKIAKDLKRWNVIWMANDTLRDLGWLDDNDSDEFGQNHDILGYSKGISSYYRGMTYHRCYVQERKEAVRGIMQAFGYGDPGSLSPTYQVNVSNELERWRRIYDRYNGMDSALTSTLTMYAQYAMMAEAFTSKVQADEAAGQTKAATFQAESANRLARSAGQLAKIATVAVPCTAASQLTRMRHACHYDPNTDLNN
ncbi:Ff.00g034850.m01.CDS01 [Fusarium sp. VM40]|nr:Ff.00g034850.m01.CDS01 [Fusarium sp. VM40]